MYSFFSIAVLLAFQLNVHNADYQVFTNPAPKPKALRIAVVPFDVFVLRQRGHVSHYQPDDMLGRAKSILMQSELTQKLRAELQTEKTFDLQDSQETNAKIAELQKDPAEFLLSYQEKLPELLGVDVVVLGWQRVMLPYSDKKVTLANSQNPKTETHVFVYSNMLEVKFEYDEVTLQNIRQTWDAVAVR